ncbi:hypothetical protein HDG34_002507 [Paraburkholderia sp. HC6.4b]|uniref:hypothetical protein n=1 Tax=unclassified Paraburkholderia TaxID=2615204 RepID=UPI0016133B2E|nr:MULTISPECIES: hypothetical protein [unclassified Paraburkholderia]MBB5408570.1 hypothetical protein [Paraburkholderia sp. HC6.4b]MBB5450402.1 hypothetical protein [Paraburkholderia sp. Kb1A]
MNEVVDSPFASGKALAESTGGRHEFSRELSRELIKREAAHRYPRDRVVATDRILMAFTSVTLAEKSQYQYAKGGNDIRGPSIKGMQAIAVEWGNLDYGWRIVSRGADVSGVPFSQIECRCIDLETGTGEEIGFIVPHWRDRSERKGGGYVLSDEREIYELCANMAMRRVRACIQACIPVDVVERGMLQADTTVNAEADTSTEAMAKMVAAFEPWGVTKEHIEHLIQRRLNAIQAAQVVTLKRIYVSLRDGMSEPGEWFDMGDAVGTGESDESQTEGTGTAAVKSRMKKKTGGAKAAPKPASKPTPKPAAKTGGAGDAKAEPKADPKAAPKAAGRRDDAPLSYAFVASALNDATDTAALDVASALIARVADAKQRIELEQMYSARMGEFDDEQG